MADIGAVCARCGTAVPVEARFCPSCGAPASLLTPGQILDGKYEILEKTGEGGMGEVYKARHIHLDEIRIIKVTKPDPLGAGPEPRRFQEEARIATLIRHPNVAALYDFSRLPDGSYYMVWEYIDGVTLEEWLRRYGALPAARAIDVAQQVLAGLEEIHAQGIVHRDLAPDNIMLRENKSGRIFAKIIDLGIAKRVATETLHHMTGTGMFVGKLKYCSPEQAGSLPPGESVDGRSDLYSFGVVLYEMLTGKPPFESQTPEGYLGKHLHTAPPPLDTARIPVLLAPGLASIVTKALEKQRDRRFADAREFSTALARLLPAASSSTNEVPTALLPGNAARGSWSWLVGGAITISVAAVALALVLHRPASAVHTPVIPVSAPSPSPEPEPTKRDAADAVVIQPRILEDEVTPPPPPPTPRRTPTHVLPTAVPPTVVAPTVVPPTPVPAGASPAATVSPEAPPELPGVGELNARKVRRIVDEWTARPVERRALQAVRVAYVVNQWVKSYPADALSVELAKSFPGTLRLESDSAFHSTPPRFGIALEFATAYLQLSFAPADSEMERRVLSLRGRIRTGKRRTEGAPRE